MGDPAPPPGGGVCSWRNPPRPSVENVTFAPEATFTVEKTDDDEETALMAAALFMVIGRPTPAPESSSVAALMVTPGEAAPSALPTAMRSAPPSTCHEP